MRCAGLGVTLCLLSLVALSSAEGSDRRDDARIIAAFSTWTQLSFITSTTTVPYTCATAISAVACRKKRKRSFGKFLTPLRVPNTEGDGDLQGSLAGPAVAKESDGSERDPKIALTVWRSQTSTFTMLMTSTDSATTFSVSFACSIMGGNFPPPC